MAPSPTFGFRSAVAALTGLGLVLAPVVALPAQANPAGTGLIITEMYAEGGNSGAALDADFVEIYNPTDSAVDLAGVTLHYRSATSTTAASGSGLIPLTGSVPAKSHFLVAGVSGSQGDKLPKPDLLTGLGAGAKGGQVFLSTSATGFVPTTALDPRIIDFVGYGNANLAEGSPAPAPASKQSVSRTAFVDTDNNKADFTAGTPTPQNSGATPPVDPVDPGTPAAPALATIAEIQGTGPASPMVGATVRTTGVVTASYPTGGLNGYYLQTAGTGGEIDLAAHRASTAVFVYSPDSVSQVEVGQHVQVEGVVSEFNGLTQITVPAGKVSVLPDAATVVPAKVTLPRTEEERERFEGMLLAPVGDFTVADTYSIHQYGEVGLASGNTALVTPTAVARPGSPEAAAAAADNAARAVTLDDGATTNFLSAANTGTPVPYVSLSNPIRVGAPVTFTRPVIFTYSFSKWRFNPTRQLTVATADSVQPATFANTRTAAPAPVAGDVRLATFNVLNYFTHLGDSDPKCVGYPDRVGNNITVQKNCDARGAWDRANFERQEKKIVSAITALNADVVGLQEIESSTRFGAGRDEALATLVAALNRAEGSDVWSYAKSPAAVPAGEDVIRTAFIYRASVAKPVGESVIAADSAFDNARQPLAQVFAPVAGGANFVAIVNHFKSKSSGTGINADQGDGQGASNPDRVKQAQALVTFADQMKQGTGVQRVFLLGDFNSYRFEDPIQVLTDAGYVDQGGKTGKHTYAYKGEVGSLDYIFASPKANTAVRGVDVWNINAGEAVALEYSRFNANVTPFYAPDMYRSSDHDPIIVGIESSDNVTLNLLNINDFHGRIDQNTVKFAGTVEQLRAAGGAANTVLLSAGDNIGASLFASALQQDQPTIDVLNALELRASSVGNHEFDQGFDDLTGRVTQAATWKHLGANVYQRGSKTPALPEYELLNVGGVSVAVIGAVTGETASLVSPGGISTIEFGDPIEAVNRVAAQLSDGDQANGEADVIIAEFHEGAGFGTPDKSTLDKEVAAGGIFARMVNETSAQVDAIFTGHTHKQYAWDAPIPGVLGGTRPIVQTGSYGEFVGQIELTFSPSADRVVSYKARNVPRTKEDDAALVTQFPRVAAVKSITDAAIAQASVIGERPVGSVSAPITRALSGGKEDRGSESTLGNLVADSLLHTLADPLWGGADFGVVNPGGLRADLPFGTDGTISYSQANAVLPFVNNLWTTTLSGVQVKTMLEQQWQRDKDGNVPSRAFLHLGLSKNVSYTFDASRPEGDRVTSITINGVAVDPARDYRVGSFSFLLQGGDNFRVFSEGTDTRDSGLVDRDAWVKFLTTESQKAPIEPSFARRAVQVSQVPASVRPGEVVSFEVSGVDLTSEGSPSNTEVVVSWEGSAVPAVVVPVSAGAARVEVTVPADVSGAGVLRVLAQPSGTSVIVPLSVLAVTPPVDGGPTDGGTPPVVEVPGEELPGAALPGAGGGPAASPAKSGPSALPFTGAAGVELWLLLGGGLVGAAALSWMVARRRSRAVAGD